MRPASGQREISVSTRHTLPVTIPYPHQTIQVCQEPVTSASPQTSAVRAMRRVWPRIKPFVLECTDQLFDQNHAAPRAHSDHHSHRVEKLRTEGAEVVVSEYNN